MWIWLILIGYLIGSVPAAWLVTKAVTGQDLRRLGSGNVGVMNVAINVARWAGWLVFLAEAAKGILGVTIARAWGGSDVEIGLAVLAVVVGTRWPIWLGGAGGRGNTAGAAALLLLSWPAVVAGLGLWALARAVTRSSFLATRLSLAALPFLLLAVSGSWVYFAFGVVLGLIYLHAQKPGTDDHSILKQRWPSLWAFLISPKRREKPAPGPDAPRSQGRNA